MAISVKRYLHDLNVRSCSPFNPNDLRDVQRFFMLVERLIDDFREHDYEHVSAPPPLHNFNLNVTLEQAFLDEPRSVSDRSNVRLLVEIRLVEAFR